MFRFRLNRKTRKQSNEFLKGKGLTVPGRLYFIFYICETQTNQSLNMYGLGLDDMCDFAFATCIILILMAFSMIQFYEPI